MRAKVKLLAAAAHEDAINGNDHRVATTLLISLNSFLQPLSLYYIVFRTVDRTSVNLPFRTPIDTTVHR